MVGLFKNLRFIQQASRTSTIKTTVADRKMIAFNYYYIVEK
jgi:hypothetical protein